MRLMNDQLLMETFKIYAVLNAEGKMLKENAKLYHTDDEVRGTLMAFANEVDCTIISADPYIYMVPLTKNSIFHMTNDEIKKQYFPSRSLNVDIYLMYVAIIIFIGEFYDSYQTTRPTRDFLTTVEWLSSLNERLMALKNIDEEILKDMEEEYAYNWLDILTNWEAMDNIKEGVRRHTARTVSRMSFILIVKQFMIKEEIAVEIGQDELCLTDKAHTIIRKYFMEYEYNKGILEFIYQLEQGETTDAGNSQD
ncbi:MAG: DUF6063 family protein [Vallitaleaceae bacterium]|nr:DUF6063 family protein [Vallitaleaceae bacterium]